MSQPRPNRAEIAAAVAVARTAAGDATTHRKSFRRRRTPRRNEILTRAQKRCENAAVPLRSWLGMTAWGGIELEDELAMKKVMEDLRYERRQIAKML